jgi:hypothetical protein
VALTGDVTGSATSADNKTLTITTTVADNSHNHSIDNVTGLNSRLEDVDTEIGNVFNYCA